MNLTCRFAIVFACLVAMNLAATDAFARGRPEAPRRLLVHPENSQRQPQPTPHSAPIEPERAPVAPGVAGASEDGRQPQRSGRLSVEERKALRRQIDDASRDVYRAPPAH